MRLVLGGGGFVAQQQAIAALRLLDARHTELAAAATAYPAALRGAWDMVMCVRPMCPRTFRVFGALLRLAAAAPGAVGWCTWRHIDALATARVPLTGALQALLKDTMAAMVHLLQAQPQVLLPCVEACGCGYRRAVRALLALLARWMCMEEDNTATRDEVAASCCFTVLSTALLCRRCCQLTLVQACLYQPLVVDMLLGRGHLHAQVFEHSPASDIAAMLQNALRKVLRVTVTVPGACGRAEAAISCLLRAAAHVSGSPALMTSDVLLGASVCNVRPELLLRAMLACRGHGFDGNALLLQAVQQQHVGLVLALARLVACQLQRAPGMPSPRGVKDAFLELCAHGGNASEWAVPDSPARRMLDALLSIRGTCAVSCGVFQHGMAAAAALGLDVVSFRVARLHAAPMCR